MIRKYKFKNINFQLKSLQSDINGKHLTPIPFLPLQYPHHINTLIFTFPRYWTQLWRDKKRMYPTAQHKYSYKWQFVRNRSASPSSQQRLIKMSYLFIFYLLCTIQPKSEVEDYKSKDMLTKQTFYQLLPPVSPFTMVKTAWQGKHCFQMDTHPH